jgi:hypothetical protein
MPSIDAQCASLQCAPPLIVLDQIIWTIIIWSISFSPGIIFTLSRLSLFNSRKSDHGTSFLRAFRRPLKGSSECEFLARRSTRSELCEAKRAFYVNQSKQSKTTQRWTAPFRSCSADSETKQAHENVSRGRKRGHLLDISSLSGKIIPEAIHFIFQSIQLYFISLHDPDITHKIIQT